METESDQNEGEVAAAFKNKAEDSSQLDQSVLVDGEVDESVPEKDELVVIE